MHARRGVQLAALLAVSATTAACGGSAPPDRRWLAAQYMTAAVAGNHRLEIDFDGLSGPDRDRLDAARADLRDAAATEKTFDTALLSLPLPPAMMATARALVAANEARAALTLRAAVSRTLDELRSYGPQLAAADASVEQQVRTIRSQLGLPPPETS